jgi:hypothetical protein
MPKLRTYIGTYIDTLNEQISDFMFRTFTPDTGNYPVDMVMVSISYLE